MIPAFILVPASGILVLPFVLVLVPVSILVLAFDLVPEEEEATSVWVWSCPITVITSNSRCGYDLFLILMSYSVIVDIILYWFAKGCQGRDVHMRRRAEGQNIVLARARSPIPAKYAVRAATVEGGSKKPSST